MMPNPRLLHYRDHHNGGKFDGVCYVDVGKQIVDFNYPIRIRFKHSEFDSGFQYLWGVGEGYNQYSLKIVRDVNDYYLRVTYLNVDYDFTEFKFGIIDEITMVTVYANSSLISIRVALDPFGNQLRLYQKTETGNSALYSVPDVNLTLGASRYDNGEEILVSGNRFTGKIFDFETHYGASGTDRQRLVFYEKAYGNDSDMVYAFNQVDNATIIDRPTDFWSTITDISGKVRDGFAPVVKYRKDSYLVQEYASTDFRLFNYFDVAVGDTIGIEIDGELTWLFNITKTKKVENGHSLKVECEDILLELKKINPAVYIWPKYSAFSYADRKWWSNYVQSGLECDFTSVSLFYILKQAIYILQYDNILNVGISELTANTDSLFYDHLNSDYIYFQNLGYSFDMFRSLNKSQSNVFDDSTFMDKVFREILFHTRLSYIIKNGWLKFYQIDSGHVDHPVIWKIEPSETETDRRYNNLKCDVCSGIFNLQNIALWGILLETIQDIYFSFNSEDIVTLEANQLDNTISEYKNEDSFNEKTLIPHLWLLIRDSVTGTLRTMYNNDDEQNFLYQLSKILDEQLRKTFELERITIPLTNSNSPKYREKTDDLASRRTEIYQEVAQ